MSRNKNNLEIATFAAGCFWGVEEVFAKIKGVVETRVGYTGGRTKKPTYEQVSSGKTGHAEAIEIKFDPALISYEELLQIFWQNHDPTTYHRQGPDVGSQYRSAIFYHNQKQKESALKSKLDLEKSKKYDDKIVTEIVRATGFYPAEEYHQKYLEKKGLKTCHF
jgi:peptide-methionine (S)-S-oxide reductase